MDGEGLGLAELRARLAMIGNAIERGEARIVVQLANIAVTVDGMERRAVALADIALLEDLQALRRLITDTAQLLRHGTVGTLISGGGAQRPAPSRRSG